MFSISNSHTSPEIIRYGIAPSARMLPHAQARALGLAVRLQRTSCRIGPQWRHQARSLCVDGLTGLQARGHPRGRPVNWHASPQQNIRLISLVHDQVLVIKLTRTDTTLDLSQEAEKNTFSAGGGAYPHGPLTESNRAWHQRGHGQKYKNRHVTVARPSLVKGERWVRSATVTYPPAAPGPLWSELSPVEGGCEQTREL